MYNAESLTMEAFYGESIIKLRAALFLVMHYPNFISPGDHEETLRKIAREALKNYETSKRI